MKVQKYSQAKATSTCGVVWRGAMDCAGDGYKLCHARKDTKLGGAWHYSRDKLGTLGMLKHNKFSPI